MCVCGVCGSICWEVGAGFFSVEGRESEISEIVTETRHLFPPAAANLIKY